MSRMTFSDEEIEELLREAENEPLLNDVIIDKRTFNYWMEGGDGMPILTLDFKYGIYMLRKFDYGDRTDQYLVEDTRDNSIVGILPLFLDMDERGELPKKIDATSGEGVKVRSKFRRRKK